MPVAMAESSTRSGVTEPRDGGVESVVATQFLLVMDGIKITMRALFDRHNAARYLLRTGRTSRGSELLDGCLDGAGQRFLGVGVIDREADGVARLGHHYVALGVLGTVM